MAASSYFICLVFAVAVSTITVVADSPETCGEKKARLEAKLESSPYPIMGLHVPSCHEDGSYKPIQCKGSMCGCVNKLDGTMLGPEVPIHLKDTLDCSGIETCGERKARVEAILESSPFPIMGMSMPSCHEDGSYRPVQCHGSVCGCVNKLDGQQFGPNVPIHLKKQMECEESTLKIQGIETCNRKKERLQYFLDSNNNPMGSFILPSCNEDGSYKSVQCRGSRCGCVDVGGSFIEPTVPIPLKDSLDCSVYSSTGVQETCAEKKARIQETLESVPYLRINLIPECDVDGSYKPIQCHGDVHPSCRCVDRRNGREVGTLIPIHLKDFIDCTMVPQTM